MLFDDSLDVFADLVVCPLVGEPAECLHYRVEHGIDEGKLADRRAQVLKADFHAMDELLEPDILYKETKSVIRIKSSVRSMA